MQEPAEAWAAAVELHLAEHGRRFGRSGYDTLYIGGGTPSALPPGILRRLLSILGAEAQAGGTLPSEWSIEANPEDVSDAFLGTIGEAGVDRLSVGVQSLEDQARYVAGRRGDSRSCIGRLESLASKWRGRWSADLMFGLPGQSVGGLERDARLLCELGAGHVSLYELTLEHGTPLHDAVQAGTVSLPDDDERADMYEAAAAALAKAGFVRYEVSNWALPGQECRHNQVYWEMGDWLAVGPAGVGNVAASRASGESGGSARGGFLRLENSRDDSRYATDPCGTVAESFVGGRDAAFECLMTALRTSRGLDAAGFARRFGFDPLEAFGRLHESYPDLVRFDGTRLFPTDRGLDALNIPLVAALSNADRFFDSGNADIGGPS